MKAERLRYLRRMTRTWLLSVFIGLVPSVQAQTGAQDRDALLVRTAAVRARLLKDSVPMTVAQLDTLWARAAGAGPVIAVRSLEQSLVIADSLQEMGRERDLLFALSEVYGRTGRDGDALIALRAAYHLKDSLASAEHERSSATAQERIMEEQRKLHDLEARYAADIKAEREAFQRAGDRARAFLIAAGIVIALLLSALVWTATRLARLKRGTGAPAAMPVPPAPAPRPNVLRPAPAPVPQVPVPADPEALMLLALFHKRMPERVLALKDARSRGDGAKVSRVVASMRPQLAQNDPERFSALCARLLAAGDEVLSEAHRPDLDALVTGVEQVLAAGLPKDLS